jgi:hypothetical protein
MIVVTSELWLAARNVSSFAAAVVFNKSERQVRQTLKERTSVIGTCELHCVTPLSAVLYL